MENILIIGGNGYVGSRLRQVLTEQYPTVDSVDRCWFNYDETSLSIDYHHLTAEELSKYQVVILLAAHAGVKPCDGDIKAPWLNNVTNFTELLTKLSKETLVIYASSASVYGNSKPGEYHREEIKQFTPVNNYDITKYVGDLHAEIAIQQGHQLIGLRFGTVNGYSPNLRVDVMINSMYYSAYHDKKIVVSNKHIGRALLGIEDLCRAVVRCIERPVPGIYNLASFNTTVEEIADTVSEKLGVPIVDQGNTNNQYDFGLDTTLFQTTFDFTFQDTPATIVDSLIKKFEEALSQRRDNYIIYQWEQDYARRKTFK